MAILGRWAIGLGILGAALAAGCDSGETTTAGTAGTGGTSGTAGAGGTGGTGGGVVCPDDPAEGPVTEECGIWVSGSKGDDASEGTQAAPVATLTHAIDLAAKGPGHVYACGETWIEAIVVPRTVSLHGGFDCSVGWAYVGETKRAKVTAPSAPSPIAATWFNGGSMKQALLTDFSIESPDAAAPGGSSIACFVRDELPLLIRRSECLAGNGADGADGTPGDPDNLPAMAGAPGSEGQDACSASITKGGAAPATACDSGMSKGGGGGDSSAMIATSGEDGEPASNPPGGAGGLGEQVAPACTAGSPGAKGANGADGLGGGKDPAAVYGQLTEQGYIGVTVEDGKLGAPGQGGGGGGATYGSAAVCGAATPGGAAGGSGGAGGCGGKGGKAAQNGGTSIGLAFLSSSVDFGERVVVRSGNGGNGGNGGPPQTGGTGGDGGNGGVGSGSIKPGCHGSKGGSGGTGGYGGGGQGGHTLALAFLNGRPFPWAKEDSQISQGKAGQGGQGNPLKVSSWGDKGINTTYGLLDP